MKDGLNYQCRSCEKARRNAWYKLHHKREAARAARYKKNLPPGVLKERKSRDQIKHAERVFKNALRWRYNCSREQYDALLAFQGHRCAVCGSTEPGGKGRWHVDHDKKCCGGKISRSCGKCIRGLLCHGCNIGIGALKTDKSVLLNAVLYLDKPPVSKMSPDLFSPQ